MKTTLQEIKEESNNESVSGVQASHALVTNVDFSNGKKSSIVTLFNCSDFSFEDVKIGVDTGLNRQPWLGITNYKSTLFKFVNGKIQKAVDYLE